MDQERWARIQELFDEALRRTKPEERQAFLEEACKDDPDSRREVESLVAHLHQATTDFMKPPERYADPAEQKPPDPLIGQWIDCYRIVRRLGIGGMGVVYLAEQSHPGRRWVALKLCGTRPDRQAAKETLARFDTERQALFCMQHSNVAAVYGGGITDHGQPYFVMEYVVGIPITEYCEKETLTLPQRLALFTQVCNAIEHAHQKAIVHRDVTARNVLVTVIDGEPTAKVIDFGLAKAMGQSLTSDAHHTVEGHFMGTPAYMSPEQAEMTGLNVDTRTDIYSLGVLLYKLLVGHLPFDPNMLRGLPDLDRCRMIREVEPPKPSARFAALGASRADVARQRRTDSATLDRCLRRDLDWVTMKALEKNRTRRYPSVSELKADIRRYLEGEPVSAHPPSLSYQVTKFAGRNRSLMGAAAAVFVVLFAAAVVSLISALAAREKMNEALRQSYITDIAAAHTALRVSDVAAVQTRLDHAPERFRSWEWPYLDASVDESLHAYRPRIGAISAVAFGTDGHRVVVGSEAGHVLILDTDYPIFEDRFEALQIGDHAVTGVFLFGSYEQPTIVSGAASGELTLLNLSSPDAPVALYVASGSPPPPVTCLALNPDQATIACGFSDGQIVTMHLPSRHSFVLPYQHHGALLDAAFGIDNGRLYSVCKAAEIYVSDALSGHEKIELFSADTVITRASFCPDGQCLATVRDDDNVVRIWRITKYGDCVPSCEIPSQARNITALAFSPTGNRIATGLNSGTITVWNAVSGDLITTLTGHDNRIRVIAYSCDDTRLVSASHDGTIRLWHTGGPRDYLNVGPDHDIYSIAVSADGQRLACGTDGGTITIWDTLSRARVCRIVTREKGTVTAVALNASGTQCAAAFEDQTIAVWSAVSGCEIAQAAAAHTERIRELAFVPTTQELVSGSLDGSMWMWRSKPSPSGAVLDGTILRKPATRTGEGAVAGSENPENGRHETTLPGSHDEIDSLAISSDGTRIACGLRHGIVEIWDITDERFVSWFKVCATHTNEYTSVAWLPDDKRLLSGTGDGNCMLWDAASGRKLKQFYEGEKSVTAVAPGPIDDRIVWRDSGGSVRLHDLSTGEEVLVLRDEFFVRGGLLTNPERLQIISISSGGRIRIWEGVPYATRFSETVEANSPALAWSHGSRTGGRMGNSKTGDLRGTE